MQNTEPIAANYDVFVETLRKVSRWWIPRSCRWQYIPGLSTDSKTFYDAYTKLYEDSFSDETITAGETLMAVIAKERRRAWQDMINGTDNDPQ